MNKLNKIAIVFIVCLLITLGVWYGLNRVPNPKEGIRIGLVAPLTGPFADWGRTIEEGMRLALQDTQHEFIVSYQDSACDPQQTVTVASQMIYREDVKIIVGPGCVTGLRAIAPIAEKNDVLLFSTGLLDDEIFEEHKNVLNLASQISTEAKYLAQYLSNQEIKSTAIVHGTNAFGREYGIRLPIFLKSYGIELVIVEPTDLGFKDFKSVILKLMNTKPEVIFIHQGEIQTGIFVKQLRELGYSIPVYGYYATEGQSVLEAGGEALDGMLYTYPVNSAEDSLEKKEFEMRYAREFGEDKIPSATSFFVYDGMMLLDRAMDECQFDDTQCVIDFFKGYGDFVGLSGNMRFQEDGSITRPFGIKMIEQGEFTWVTKGIRLEE